MAIVLWAQHQLAVSNTLDKRKKEQQIDNEDEDFEIDPLSQILDLVSTCKEIVTRVKRSRIQGQLSTTLKQAVSTRWNSIYVMMKSISKNLPDLKHVEDRQLQKNLMDINDNLLINVIKVLEHLDTATRLLSADKMPTLHLVVPVRVRLIKNLSIMADDTESIKALKIELIKQLEKYYKSNDLHITAALMDPRLKNNVGIMSPEVQERVLPNIRHMIKELPPNYVSMTNMDSETDFEGPSLNAPEPAAKKAKVSYSLFISYSMISKEEINI